MWHSVLVLVGVAVGWSVQVSCYIVCPDGTVCGNDNTCCQSSVGYGCCPHPQVCLCVCSCSFCYTFTSKAPYGEQFGDTTVCLLTSRYELGCLLKGTLGHWDFNQRTDYTLLLPPLSPRRCAALTWNTAVQTATIVTSAPSVLRRAIHCSACPWGRRCSPGDRAAPPLPFPSHASRGSGPFWVREELKAQRVGWSTAKRKTTAPAPRARSAAEEPTEAGSAAPSPLWVKLMNCFF